MSDPQEHTLAFHCGEEQLLGIVSAAAPAGRRGVLIVVGGPQYRAGSHRQFTLLARHLARGGVPAMRFDCRGMGDSSGERRSFEQIDEDIRCAIDAYMRALPSLEEIVIWGLCDAASATLFYAHRDRRVKGVVLVNPWVRSEQGVAKAYLKHYYTRRLFQRGLWRKILHGEFDARAAVASLRKLILAVASRARPGGAATPFQERMLDGLRKFSGSVLIVLSGDDLTAREFSDFTSASPQWRRALDSARVTCRQFPEANHTFARREWRDQLARWTEEWLKTF